MISVIALSPYLLPLTFVSFRRPFDNRRSKFGFHFSLLFSSSGLLAFRKNAPFEYTGRDGDSIGNNGEWKQTKHRVFLLDSVRNELLARTQTSIIVHFQSYFNMHFANNNNDNCRVQLVQQHVCSCNCSHSHRHREIISFDKRKEPEK